MILRKRETRGAEIPTASMADIAFLLIIFFMLTTVFATEKGLQIVLPEKGEKVKIKKENIKSVFVNARGQVKIGDDEVTLDQIKAKVATMIGENPDVTFSLKIDRKCKYEKVIKIFDELKLAFASLNMEEKIAFAPPRGGPE